MKIRDIVKLMIKEAQEDDPNQEDPIQADPNQDPAAVDQQNDQQAQQDQQGTEEQPDGIEVMLKKFKILVPVLNQLLGAKPDELPNLISNISVVVYKPTTFKVTFKNGNDFILKYSPHPVEVNGISRSDFKPKDFFQVEIVGKKFNLINISEFEQALDYIATALRTGPVTKQAPTGETSDGSGTNGVDTSNTQSQPAS